MNCVLPWIVNLGPSVPDTTQQYLLLRPLTILVDHCVSVNRLFHRIIQDRTKVNNLSVQAEILEHPPLVDPGNETDGFLADPDGIARPWEPEKPGTE